jgi:protein involved in polysaccharide export with SLBB domain
MAGVPREATAEAYRVQIGDELAIRLYLTPELNEEVTVRPDGNITTTLAQIVPAAGRTPEQIAASLRVAYASELKDPAITVGVKSYAPMRVYVAGEVPGPGELTTSGPPLTLLQAISRAGGLRVTGDADGVLIVRRGPDGRAGVYAAHYAQAVSGEDPGADVTLRPYDVVIVPRTGIANVYVWVNQHIQQFVPVSWGFSYNVNPFIKK